MHYAAPLGLVVSTLFGSAQAATFSIDAQKFNNTNFAISAFVESNINRGDDGGLYAELIQNRAFQEDDNYLVIPGWLNYGNSILSKDSNVPLSALPKSLEIYVPGNTSRLSGERAGVNNTGWWGIPIKAQPYQASFWIKADQGSKLAGSIQLSLASLTDHKTYASATFDTSQVTTSWKQFKTTLHPTANAPDANNVLSLSMEVQDHDQYAWFNLISLFPPTFKNRTNGLRPDIATALQDLKPGLFRIAGGNDLLGNTIDHRFNWSSTLGDLQDRPGRDGLWVGCQTEGLGIKELLDMCEDIGASPILGIWVGYADDNESIPNNNQMDKYIQSALDELDFILADSKTNVWAKRRAELGHPEPYKLQYVELGNEDFTSTTYPYRWNRFYTALKAAYPHLTYVATTTVPNTFLPSVDIHDYAGPGTYIRMFNRFDNWPRNGSVILELENAVINTNDQNPFGTPQTRLFTPTLQSSLAEAVYIVGMQRNGDLVVGTSYAPYLANNNSIQWTPNFINFNATTVSLSTSYYVHQMISLAQANRSHAVTSDTSFGPLYWVATSTNNSKTFFLQVVNVQNTVQPLTVNIQNLKSSPTTAPKASATVLTTGPGQDQTVTNSLNSLNAIVPSTQKITTSVSGNTLHFNASVPGWSFNVYRIDL